MASNPQLSNHLIRELSNMIRFKTDGDAMVLLALSGKEPFSVFQYVVENHVIAVTDLSKIVIQNWPPSRSWLSRIILFLSNESKHLVCRFIRELNAKFDPFDGLWKLPFEKIIKLSVHDCVSSDTFTSMLSSWTDTIEILNLIHVSDNNFNNVVNGTYPLTNLRNLEINLTFNQLLKLMSTTSSFSLPEDVTFNFVVKKEPSDDFGFPNTFPKVKRFVAKVNFWTPMTAEVLHRLSAIIKCFTDLETAKIIINSDHCWRSHGFNEIVKFHEWLRDTNFSVPVNVNVSENVDISYLSENPQSMYDKLKSFGYKDDGSMNLCNTGFVIEKEYGNVKLIHHISHYDSFVCVSDY